MDTNKKSYFAVILWFKFKKLSGSLLLVDSSTWEICRYPQKVLSLIKTILVSGCCWEYLGVVNVYTSRCG